MLAQDENELTPVISPPPPARALATPSVAPSPTPTLQMSPAASASPPASPTPLQLTDVLFKNLKARAIGPAVMGGRVSDIAIDPRNPAVFFVGLATGGLFKTSDNGITFSPVFDKEPLLSIGAIAIASSDSDVVWVGTGEANDRNSSEWGDGVYRSTDGGGTWDNVGLKESRAIARIVVDPK
ncbi:MAG: WD40/YVTN/BNR-like repeat-containing protein, partial [Chthoniobacterales bacterium]